MANQDFLIGNQLILPLKTNLSPSAFFHPRGVPIRRPVGFRRLPVLKRIHNLLLQLLPTRALRRVNTSHPRHHWHRVRRARAPDQLELPKVDRARAVCVRHLA